MEEFDVYGFCVEVFKDELGEWNYAVIQEFDNEVEVLLTGCEDTYKQALAKVGEFVSSIEFEE